MGERLEKRMVESFPREKNKNNKKKEREEILLMLSSENSFTFQKTSKRLFFLISYISVHLFFMLNCFKNILHWCSEGKKIIGLGYERIYMSFKFFVVLGFSPHLWTGFNAK